MKIYCWYNIIKRNTLNFPDALKYMDKYTEFITSYHVTLLNFRESIT